MRRTSLALVGLFALACASAPARPLAPPPTPRSTPLVLGINDGFHGPLSPDLVDTACGWNEPWERTPHLSTDSLRAFVASVASCASIHVLALVEGPDPALAAQLASVAGVDALEVGNELELPPHNLSQPAYVDAIVHMHDAARQAGFHGEIIAGAVYALTEDTKRRVEAMLPACQDCAVGLHVYEEPDAADLDWIRSLQRRVWVTETGSPTGCGTAKWQEQADFLRGMLATLGTVENIVGVIVYQRPAGPTCSNLDTFSIAGKPAEELLR